METVGSTNTWLLAQARDGAPAGLAVVADHQTAGRGRLGRRWEAPPGACLLASVLLRPVLDPDRLYLCTAAVALAAADACDRVAGVRPALKWPNDLLFGEAKLAGILAEADPDAPGGPPGSVAVVVGIGCNVDWPGPAEAGGTCLADHGRPAGEAGGPGGPGGARRPVDRFELLEALLERLAPRVEALGSASGRSVLARELREHCGTLGRSVRVELPDRVLTGVAVDVTEAGHLVVDTGEGRETVAAGDVVHLRPAAGPPTEGPTEAG
ncbi:MAG TPA: biotin--[acetyl-CoA-carboxylase] ligase [Acidimicrobiales bacterium]|nr:biotin--[acetyl-CoA-carboxylase] ligase [Acidimicrobiales bacterium]